MAYGSSLSLREAAEFAGVSEVTMRAWAKEIPNVGRNPDGSYEIHPNDLQKYLAVKPRRNHGATRAKEGGSSGEASGEVALARELLNEVKADRDNLRAELAAARARESELQSAFQRRENLLQEKLDSASHRIMQLSLEMKELVFNRHKPGLSALIPQVAPKEQRRPADTKTGRAKPKVGKNLPAKKKVTKSLPKKKAVKKTKKR